MNPAVSWGVVLLIFAGGYYYYVYIPNQARATAERHAQAQAVVEQSQASTQRRRVDKPKTSSSRSIERHTEQPPTYAEALATGVSNPQKQGKKRKAGKQQPTQIVAPTPAPPVQTQEDANEDVDKDWAARLQAAQQGVSFNSASRENNSGNNAKTKKNKKRQNGNIGEQTAQEFYAGTDAAVIPTETTASAQVPSGRDVSDMLEAPMPGPSTLRITGEQKQKRPQAPKQVEPQETKKQRQNRRKAEEKKALREEEERIRQALLEKQRREAREARGEPAKNGLAPSHAPSASAWSAPVKSQSQATNSNGGTLFDTFDHDGLSTASSNELTTNSTSPATRSSMYGQDFPSEDAQIQMLNEMNGNGGWNEVSKSKKNKKKGQVSPQTESTSGKENGDLPIPPTTNNLLNGSVKPSGTDAKAKKPNGFALLNDTSVTGAMQSHPEDSDWAVA